MHTVFESSPNDKNDPISFEYEIRSIDKTTNKVPTYYNNIYIIIINFIINTIIFIIII